MNEVYTLFMEVTKTKGDDLPNDATGAAFILFAPAQSEEEAVREAVKLFREAGLNPLEVVNHGTIAERMADGFEFAEEERALVDEALEKNAIIILDKQPIFGEDDPMVRN